jgi:cell division septal protein FtsQ
MKRFAISIAVIVTCLFAYLLGWTNILAVDRVEISAKDSEIKNQIEIKLAQPTQIIAIGTPIARIDRREISARLRELVWVDSVDVKRNFVTGVVKVSVSPREPLARLSAGPDGSTIGFLSKDLSLFYLPKEAVNSASKAGQVDWGKLPILSLGSQQEVLKGSVVTLLTKIRGAGIGKRNLDISWGTVKEFELKLKIINELLAQPENKKIGKIDISRPTNPVVK